MPRKAKRKPQKSASASVGQKAAKARAGARVAKHRAGLRAKGMRLVQIWVPDTRSAAFKAEARRQSRLLAKAAQDPTSDEAQMMREAEAHAAELWAKLDADEAAAARRRRRRRAS